MQNLAGGTLLALTIYAPEKALRENHSKVLLLKQILKTYQKDNSK